MMGEYESLDAQVFEPENEVQAPPSIAPGEIVLGTFVDMDGEGNPLVDYPLNPSARPITAISTLGLTRQQLDRPVALLFADGDISKPIIVGLIHSPLYSLLDNVQEARAESPVEEGEVAEAELKAAKVDGESVVIEGKKEVVLKCGDASITLTRSGKILIRGKYLLNRSSGVNRIMGGSVQVN
jgi:hypothetical protein